MSVSRATRWATAADNGAATAASGGAWMGEGSGDGMDGDYNDLRVLEVLVDGEGAVTALRVEAIWGTRRGMDEPLVWDRAIFTVGAVGPLAGLNEGDRLELRPAGDGT